MKIKEEWNNWKVFWTSSVTALVLAILLERFYESAFGPVIGSVLSFGFPDKITTYSGTFFLIYILVLSFLYNGFSKNFRPSALAYFLVVPFLLFLSSGQHLIAALIMLTVGLAFGSLAKRFTI